MQRLLSSLSGSDLGFPALLAAGALVVVALLAAVLVAVLRGARHTTAQLVTEAQRSGEMERRLADMLRVQSEMTGRMQTMAEIFSGRTSDLARLLSERIDASSHRVNQNMTETREKTDETLARLNERLAVIDRAQSEITALSGEIVSLQSILSNKQQRGAFGQGRMEAIVADGLAMGSYSFQTTLSNGTRPDCLIHLPNNAPPLVVDAKFPLEAWQRLRTAEDAEMLRQAQAAFRQDIAVHIKAIADKYLLRGETHDTAFMFVPSEAIFAELHEHFDELIQRAARARVVIVSPSLLLLAIQVIQALLRDVRMREQAHLVQREVGLLLDDARRLAERTVKLQAHFTQAGGDLEAILTSARKLERRGERISSMEVLEDTSRVGGSAA